MKNIVSNTSPEPQSVTVIGNYLPRKCGIATFTTDLVESFTANSNIGDCKAIAMNDRPEGYDYEDVVQYEINQDELEEYHQAAEFINMDQPDVICLQHEFGIFGGAAGEYILNLLQEVDAPVVTTLHTVLTEPSSQQQSVMKQLVKLSDRLVVMSKSAVHILNTIYDIPKEKIVFIPHGIPDIPFDKSSDYKERFNLSDKKVLLTFGLLSENKGIEYVIKGLPEAVKKFPDLKYIVLGATHPGVLEHEGERYRRKLQHLVQKLNLEDHVVFENRFVSFEKLCEYLGATDIYITPYNNEEQITSGTLAYACGTGKAVISTPYWYATEMLSEGRGRLVPFKDEGAMAESIMDLFEHDNKRHQMRRRAYDYSRSAVWKEVAGQYGEIFGKVKEESLHRPHNQEAAEANQLTESLMKKEYKLPPIKMNHLSALTDDTGILQHARYTIPNRDHGYCTDDNARALLVAQQALKLSAIDYEEVKQLQWMSDRYLSFLSHALNEDTGRFRNFMNYSRQWLNPVGSEDSHGRALWTLGATVALSKRQSDKKLASTLFRQGLSATKSFTSPRAIAFTLIGLEGYLSEFAGDSNARRIGTGLAERLLKQFRDSQTEEWPWMEDILTYSNGKLSHALIVAGGFLQREDITETGLESLQWLMEVQTENGHLSPIGNRGWYRRGEQKARFDQQPLEAQGLLEACIAAYRLSGEADWLKQADICFKWFLGSNDLKKPLYDARNGGCCDGLESNKVNENQGAESTLAWLLSLTAMHALSAEKSVKQQLVHTDNSYTANAH